MGGVESEGQVGRRLRPVGKGDFVGLPEIADIHGPFEAHSLIGESVGARSRRPRRSFPVQLLDPHRSALSVVARIERE